MVTLNVGEECGYVCVGMYVWVEERKGGGGVTCSSDPCVCVCLPRHAMGGVLSEGREGRRKTGNESETRERERERERKRERERERERERLRLLIVDQGHPYEHCSTNNRRCAGFIIP